MISLISKSSILKLLLLLSLGFSTLFSNSLVLSEEEKRWIQNHRDVTFTGDPNWLPFEAFNEKGHYIGIVADHLDIIEHKTGLHFVPRVVKSWSESLEIAKTGKVSLVSGDIADKVLNQHFKPIDPYLLNPIVIIMNHELLDEHNHFIESLQSLQGQKIAMIRGYGYIADVYKRYPNMDFIEIENIQEGLNGLSTGKYDVLLASEMLASHTISQMGMDKLRIVGKTPIIMSVTLFVDKNQPLLYSIINKAITSISAKQKHEIYDKWTNTGKTRLEYKWILIILFLAFVSFAVLLNLYRKAVKAKELYSFAVEGSQDALWNWDIKKDISYFSPRFKEMMGLEENECFSENPNWIDNVHPDDRGSVLALIEENLKGHSDTLDTQYRIRHKNGTWVWVHARAKTFYDFEGRPSRMDGICRDITAEKELSLELMKSRQLLHTIIDNIPVRIFWKDTNGVYLGYNKLFASDIDKDSHKNYIGLSDRDMPWKSEAESYMNDDQAVMTSGIAKLNFEEQQTKPDGHKMWLSTSKVPLIDDEGNAYGVLGAYYDITEHKNIQLENEKTTKRLETAQQLSHIGSWEWDMISGDLIWSDEVYRIFGEEPQSFTPTYEAFTSYIPDEYLKGLEEAVSIAIKTKEPYEYDHEVRCKDGSIRLVREAGYIRFNEKGEPISMLGTLMNINSIVVAETAIQENQELTRRLEQFDKNIIASNTDAKGIITYASQAFAKISGYSLDELIGKPQNIVRHEDTPPELFKELWQTIQSGSIWHGEIQNRAKDGSTYWVDTTITPMLDAQDKIIGYSSIRRDITHEKQVIDLHRSLEKKSLELQGLNTDLERRIKEAVEQSKQKDHLMTQQSKLASMGEMIGNIAHQWRQPLNALALLLQKQLMLYERGMLNDEKVKESVQKGTILINKMSTTIDDFRDFFKPNKEKKDFDIKNAVDDTFELINAALYNKNISLHINLQEGYIIHGYKNEFSQVILNLINNAKDILIEKAIEHPEIDINATVENGKITLEVADNAGGIDEDIIEHVFEPYFTTKEEGKGTGIGLYMSKMIIEENMHGKLDVKNSDKGAVFSITLDLNHNP